MGLTCLKCSCIQKRFLSVEEAGGILLGSFPKRVRLDEQGRVCEELIDIFTVYRAWKAIERLDLGN